MMQPHPNRKKTSRHRKGGGKGVWGWILYDCGNSAFATTIMAGFFPVFFKNYWSSGTGINTSTAMLGFGNSVASLLVAFMAPLLGAIADRKAWKKEFLAFFAYLGSVMTFLLFFVGRGEWPFALLLYAAGVIGFSGANTFYDALLPSVAPPGKIDYISSQGYAMGYLGGGLLFALNVVMTIMPARFGLADQGQAVRLSFVSVAVWWGLFTLLPLRWIPSEQSRKALRSSALLGGFNQIRSTLKKIREFKPVLLFLIAYWLYIDGVDTIIRMAVDYGLSLGFDAVDLIIALLIVQFVGFPASLAFGKLGERWGARRAIFLGIYCYMGITVWGALMTAKDEFYLLAVLIGLVQGGIQALSRSYYAGLIPEGHAAEFYGFYNMTGKFAAILGPALMGSTGLLVRRILMPPGPTEQQRVYITHFASRCSIAAILVLFLAGLFFFYLADKSKARFSTT
jgi:MFS transporter, UMF1 family